MSGPVQAGSREPYRTRRRGMWHCPHRGCPDRRTTYSVAKQHAAVPHYLCSCGRWFVRRGLLAHLAQVRRYGSEHPPAEVERLRRFQ